jgi:carboxyl-terminal processing protease
VELPAVKTQLFPASIGYIKLPRFGRQVAAEFERMLDGLEALGLQALILDLRGNPGGDLDQAVKIVDLFVGEKDHPILTERGPDGSKESFPNAAQKPFHPMIVLVNRTSASAAEVVAGALQDFQRAVVLGEHTFGKGVKQAGLQLSPQFQALLGGESRFLLTTRYLYLPLGRSIQGERGLSGREGGIDPDILVEEERETYPGGKLIEVARLQYSMEMDDYVHKNLEALKGLYREGKLSEAGRFPDFEGLYRSLQTQLSRSDVRYAVRSLIRQHLEDERGEEFGTDFRDDAQLQRAILEALIRLGRDAAQVPEYKDLVQPLKGCK